MLTILHFDSRRILPIDGTIADRWGRISAVAKAAGSSLPVIDGLLAATTMQHNLVMVSRDETYLAIAGIEIFNPWRP